MTKVMKKLNEMRHSDVKPKDLKLTKKRDAKKDEITVEEVIRRYEKACC